MRVDVIFAPFALACLAEAVVSSQKRNETNDQVPPHLVDLPNGDGRIRGVVETDLGSRRFHGIPFAKPPLGVLRFMPPLPNDPWAPQLLMATHFKANCAQAGEVSGPAWNGLSNWFSEDCLYLNVYAPLPPSNQDGHDFPVGVFIHGGGLYSGGADDKQLRAQHLAGIKKMVIVTANYRLGIFGWLGSRQLRALSGDGSTGNAGFQDQQMALRWVQANIAAFRGDSNRILLFGESSGAAMVSSHMVAPGSQGLFQRAAMQSGGFVPWTHKTIEVAQAIYDFFIERTTCATAGEYAVNCLQSMPWRQLVSLVDQAVNGWYGYPEMPYPDGWSNSSWAATIDGVVLHGPVNILARQGNISRIPVMLGSNLDEGVAFAGPCPICRSYLNETMSEEYYTEWAESNFGAHWAKRVMEHYSLDDYTPFRAASMFVGDYVVRCPTIGAAKFLTAHWRGAHDEPLVYLYSFTHDPISRDLHQGSLCTQGTQGAFHGAEIPYFMGVPVYLKTKHEVALSQRMTSYLRNFAWSGNPNLAPPFVDEEVIFWPRFSNETLESLELGARPDGQTRVEAGKLERECAFVNSFDRASFGHLL